MIRVELRHGLAGRGRRRACCHWRRGAVGRGRVDRVWVGTGRLTVARASVAGPTLSVTQIGAWHCDDRAMTTLDGCREHARQSDLSSVLQRSCLVALKAILPVEYPARTHRG